MKRKLLSIGIFAYFLVTGVVANAEANTHDMGTAIQDLTPPHQIEMYLDGYHSYKRELDLPAEKQSQIRTAHYCKQISPDMFQCIIYDGNSKDARAIGIEYVITDKLFQTLPINERKYWHPHDGEVDSGLLILPGLPADKQKQILTSLRSTYGKTWQVWNRLDDKVPLGEPALMWNVNPDKVNKDTKQSVSSRIINPAF